MQPRLLFGIAFSAVAHITLLGSASVEPHLVSANQFARRAEIEIELSPFNMSNRAAASPTQQLEPQAHGTPSSDDNLHARVHGGGGTLAGPTEVTFLVSRIDAVVLTDVARANERMSQAAHADVSDHMQSPELRRATPHPMDTATLTTDQHGIAARESQRRLSQTAARERPQDSHDSFRQASHDAPAVERREATRTRETRPAVVSATLAVLTHETGRASDNLDAPLRAASPTPQLADTSVRRGERNEGASGLGAPGAAGDRGSAQQGGHARAYGSRSGIDRESADFVLWHRNLGREIGNRVRFPDTHRINLDQGTAIVSVRVDSEGHPLNAPHIVRSSGFPAMDEEALRAVRNALPFARPPAFAGNANHVDVRIPVHFSNPLFQ